MVTEVVQTEKEERKARQKIRMLWVIITLDILVFAYVAYEIVMLAISLAQTK